MRGKYFQMDFHSIIYFSCVDKGRLKQRKRSIRNLWVYEVWVYTVNTEQCTLVVDAHCTLYISATFSFHANIYTTHSFFNLRNNLLRRAGMERWRCFSLSEIKIKRQYYYYIVFFRSYKRVRKRYAIKYHRICHFYDDILRAYHTKTRCERDKKNHFNRRVRLICCAIYFLRPESHSDNICIMLHVRWQSMLYRVETFKRNKEEENERKKRQTENTNEDECREREVSQWKRTHAHAQEERKTFSLLPFEDVCLLTAVGRLHIVVQTSDSHKKTSAFVANYVTVNLRSL